ncbi:MAG TPA: helix-turn-helix domain-containing protein [Candidatus Methylomirabilis sp.]|nr:helix-turn-helix domain-containing protein [Candidatus Methylomirabilis sp.]
MAETQRDAFRVTLSEAARLFGIHEKTLRRALKRGDIRYVVVRGRYRLHFESLMAWSQKTATVRNKRDSRGIGQWVDRWRIRNTLYSPRPPISES